MDLQPIDMNKRKLLTLFIIALSTTIFRVILQPFMPSGNDNLFPPSVFVQTGLLPLAFTIFGLITYGLLAVVFVLIQEGLIGSRMKKGLMFGLSFGMMWALFLLEPLPHGSGTSLIEFLAYPLVDGITLVFMGVLLGRFIATDSQRQERACMSIGMISSISALAAITGSFLAGRLLSYNVLHIYSSYTTRPLDTMIWATAAGIWIGIMYLLLCSGNAGNAGSASNTAKSPVTKALYFGILIFGIDYLLFSLFLILVFDYKIWPVGALLSYADLILRVAIDIIFVTAGVYIYGAILKMKQI